MYKDPGLRKTRLILCTESERILEEKDFFFVVTTSKLISEKWLQGRSVGEVDGYRTGQIEKCLKQKWRVQKLRPLHKLLIYYSI